MMIMLIIMIVKNAANFGDGNLHIRMSVTVSLFNRRPLLLKAKTAVNTAVENFRIF